MAEIKVPIRSEEDIVLARQTARQFAQGMGFGAVDRTRILTAVSELTRNIREYAHKGIVIFNQVAKDGRDGLNIVFEDQGPGIPDVGKALEDGFSSHRGMGQGLPGARRLVDEFAIESEVGVGTTIVITKWV